MGLTLQVTSDPVPGVASCAARTARLPPTEAPPPVGPGPPRSPGRVAPRTCAPSRERAAESAPNPINAIDMGTESNCRSTSRSLVLSLTSGLVDLPGLSGEERRLESCHCFEESSSSEVCWCEGFLEFSFTRQCHRQDMTSFHLFIIVKFAENSVLDGARTACDSVLNSNFQHANSKPVEALLFPPPVLHRDWKL